MKRERPSSKAITPPSFMLDTNVFDVLMQWPTAALALRAPGCLGISWLTTPVQEWELERLPKAKKQTYQSLPRIVVDSTQIPGEIRDGDQQIAWLSQKSKAILVTDDKDLHQWGKKHLPRLVIWNSAQLCRWLWKQSRSS